MEEEMAMNLPKEGEEEVETGRTCQILLPMATFLLNKEKRRILFLNKKKIAVKTTRTVETVKAADMA